MSQLPNPDAVSTRQNRESYKKIKELIATGATSARLGSSRLDAVKKRVMTTHPRLIPVIPDSADESP
jgi:hypothetical protein